MVLYVFGFIGYPPLCIGATVFMDRCGGKPSERGRLKIKVRKGAKCHNIARLEPMTLGYMGRALNHQAIYYNTKNIIFIYVLL